MCASLADVPATVRGTRRRVLGAALLAWLASALVWLAQANPLSLGLVIGLVGFGAMITMAWGPRAGPIAFAPVLATIFALTLPSRLASSAEPLAWTALGCLAYLGWSIATAPLLQPVYRTRALIAALDATVRLLRGRAALLEAAPGRLEDALPPWIGDESLLAERLQTARDLLFSAPDSPRARSETAALVEAIDVRDLLLASRLDLDLLGDDESARALRGRVAGALRNVADALERSAAMSRPDPPARQTGARAGTKQPLVEPALLDGIFDATDRRALLLSAFATRLDRLAAGVQRIDERLRGEGEPLPISREQLRTFAAAESWPLSTLRANLSLASPVFRHAARMGLALMVAYFIALQLPWGAHPHWLVLGVAVVLRGTLEQTLARRNDRVSGTVIGCLLVMGIARANSAPLMILAFLAGVGVAHAFVMVRYRVTAIAATVMALLQAHLVDPQASLAIFERLADTVLGAALAWGFSYVLPSWERRTLPRQIERALAALQSYAGHALRSDPHAGVAQRLARRAAYDALGTVSAALQRSRVEPRGVRPPLAELASMLDAAQRLMAHLSVIRMSLALRADSPQRAESLAAVHRADRLLQQALDRSAAEAEPIEPPLPGALPEAAPQEDPAAWLLRRLRIAVADALAVRSTADAALASLGEQRPDVSRMPLMRRSRRARRAS
ncbi:MAG: FUSC family protein [Burkholderiaceae bacterium]|nr:FUSC family protein [Burkholderiaceae bacterium]